MWQYPNPFTLTVSPKSADIDGLNHTNNGVYARWCEQVAWAHSNALGITVDDYQAQGKAMAIRHAEYDYLAASYENDELVIGTWLTNFDQKYKFERRFQIVRPSDGVTILKGKWLLLCIDLHSGKASRMPEQFHAGYGGAVIDVED
ncbi:MAG: acyl-CoA thioesterase [Cellvibrionaceae bacterium]